MGVPLPDAFIASFLRVCGLGPPHALRVRDLEYGGRRRRERVLPRPARSDALPVRRRRERFLLSSRHGGRLCHKRNAPPGGRRGPSLGRKPGDLVHGRCARDSHNRSADVCRQSSHSRRTNARLDLNALAVLAQLPPRIVHDHRSSRRASEASL
eukprot:Amastigsp_a1929_27.p2 type:complete len:154 gc:universal Amastigsp_a1929_27:124-585(+)